MDSLPAVVFAAGGPPGTMCRYGSPPSGSIFMTRAARSPSSAVDSGAAMTVANDDRDSLEWGCICLRNGSRRWW